MYIPMLRNYVNGCHGNNAFFIVQKSLSLWIKILCISGVPMNDLAPMKNCPGGGGCKVCQISSRGTTYMSRKLALSFQVLHSKMMFESA